MEGQTEIEDLESKSFSTPTNDSELYNAIRHRWNWTFCASASLLSSKYLLFDLGFHFPLHLHLVQLFGAGTFVFLCSRGTPRPLDTTAKPVTRLGWILLIATSGFVALSMLLTFQAILLYPNIATIPMLATVALLAELSIGIFSGRVRRSMYDYLRILVLTLGCVGILYGEYRMIVKGLAAAILAALFTGVARALHGVTVEHVPQVASNPTRFNTLVCGTGLALTTMCSLSFESTAIAFATLRIGHLPILSLNILTTSFAIMQGKSILLPIDALEERGSVHSRYDARIGDAMTILGLTGAIGYASMAMLRRPYTTRVQLISLFITIVAIAARPILRWFRDWQNTPRGYTMATVSPDLDSVDTDDTFCSEDSTETVVSDAHNRRREAYLRLVSVSVILASLWVAFPMLNFADRLYPRPLKHAPILDRGYSPSRPSEVVISMCKEPIADVQFLVSSLRNMSTLANARFQIYVKDSDANVTTIKDQTGVDDVTILPNVGREGQTYLYHILNSWDSLAKHNIFLQADVHNPREFYPRIRNYFDPERTGMLSLGFSGNVCNCNDCDDLFGWSDDAHLLPTIHSRIYYNSRQCDNVLLAYKGQFVVSAKRIRGIDKAVYQDLHDAFIDENSWAHQEPYLQGRVDSMSAPVFGYSVERLWNLLFQCSDMDVAWRCPTLLSGNRIGGNIEDCQCFD